MSAYMSFYIRANDKFYPIGTYGRSTAIYEMFESETRVQWEHIIPISKKDLNRILDVVNINIDEFNTAITSLNEKINFIKTANNSLEDKIEEYGYIKETIDDYEDRIKELRWTANFASFLSDILDDADGTKYYDEIETINPSEYIYTGIEIGCPSIDDII